MSSDRIDLQRASETARAMAADLIDAAAGALVTHGGDPLNNAIVAAGFAYALVILGDQLDSRIPQSVADRLRDAA